MTMKFGKTFLSHQIPEWSIYYMNYKHLKKIIKNLEKVHFVDANPDDIPEITSTVLSQFFYELDRDIEKVDDFYNTKSREYVRRLDRIVSILGYLDGKVTHQIVSDDEFEEVISILLELRTIYRNLKWFGELNHKGFVKILKKLDKKMLYLQNTANSSLNPGQKSISLPTNNRENYLETRVEALPFAHGGDISVGLDKISKLLKILGATQADGNKSVNSNFDFLKVKSRRHSIDPETLDNFYKLISKDDPIKLKSLLDEASLENNSSKLYLSLLIKSCLMNSLNCIDMLFESLSRINRAESPSNPLKDKDDICGRGFFHQYIVSLGKSQLLATQKTEQVKPGEALDLDRYYGNKGGPDAIQLSHMELKGFVHILSKIEKSNEELKQMIMSKDNYLRTPLHYAAQYGLKEVSKLILEYSSEWNYTPKGVAIDDLNYWGDQDGLSPIHLSVVGKHPKTTDYLIKYSGTEQLKSSNLLLLAVRLNCLETLQILIENGKLDIDYTDFENNNETALYIASKLNYIDLVKYLLVEGADTEIGESIFGWTPIFVAAAEGFREVIELLIKYNARYDIVDDSGWLPIEHACLRGHLDVSDLLKPKDDKLLLYDIYNPSKNPQREVNPSSRSPTIRATASPDLLQSTSSVEKLPESNKQAVNEVYKQLKQLDSSNSVNSLNRKPTSRSISPSRKKIFKPIKSFGHRYLNADESLLLITIGTTDLRDNSPPVELNKVSFAKTFFTELDTALSLRITCRKVQNQNELIEPPVIIDLPLEDQHGSATDPITFKLSNNLVASDVMVTFDIVPTYQYSSGNDSQNMYSHEKKVLGRAIALLDNAYTKVGPHLRSLNNTITVPIIESTTLDHLGKIRFEYLCVSPFNHPNLNISRTDTYWKQLVSTRVIGHRGLGKNVSSRNSLQLGENTVESFIAAASLGASYVEFDVQLTKDFVPVVYHDFTVAESGVDIPMHAMTAEQFLGLKEEEENPIASSTTRKNLARNGDYKANGKANYSLDDEMLGRMNRPRSMSSYKPVAELKNGDARDNTLKSEDEVDRELREEMIRRMKLTKTWKDKGFKGNARGLSIASNFVTLRELFKKLPKNVGFNIELKYPMLDEAECESMGEIGIDLNFYVDTILKVVYDENTTKRDILFSSFHPDICLLLSLKQPSIPILFLTEAGTEKMADIRASSLQNAIRFAKKWNLLGIVSAANTLVKTPRLAQVVKSSGLVCVTYGVQNNSPELAKIQMRAGVDAVIADSVLAVREGLRKEQENMKELDDSSASDN